MEESLKEWIEKVDAQREAWQAEAQQILHLASQVCQQLKLGGTLSLFGSAANGFGSASSDVDLVFTVNEGDDTPPVDILKSIEGFLHSVGEQQGDEAVYFNLTRVYQVRQPVLKLTNRIGIEVDLVVNNHLGVRNTQLLKAYHDWDRLPNTGHTLPGTQGRTEIVVRTLKEWARRCGLLGTVDGMINSYAFTLMVIFFLQMRGILPNLQRLGHSLPSQMVEGKHETKFLDPSEYRCPSDTVELPDAIWMLVLSFFRFYSEFDWQANAVCVRLATTQRFVTKKELKFGEKPAWYIEDPFDLNNLSTGTSPQGRERILTAMRSAAAHAATMGGGLNWHTLCPIDLDKQCTQTFLKIKNLQPGNMESFVRDVWAFLEPKHALRAYIDTANMEVLAQFGSWEDLRACQKCNEETLSGSTNGVMAMYISLGYGLWEDRQKFTAIPPLPNGVNASTVEKELESVFEPLPFIQAAPAPPSGAPPFPANGIPGPMYGMGPGGMGAPYAFPPGMMGDPSMGLPGGIPPQAVYGHYPGGRPPAGMVDPRAQMGMPPFGMPPYNPYGPPWGQY
mmetsp:Transcript_35652/g.65347  ORF Transcript_35652/g.65347 Transcript_35652/m.65347 type:complete len:562 (+) Transcript_35652:42-1727(+)